MGEDRVPWTVWLDDEALWRRMTTLSQVVLLTDAERGEFRKKLEEILAGEGVERNDEGEIAVHGFTYLAWTDRM